MDDAGRTEVAEDGASAGGVLGVVVRNGRVEGLPRTDRMGEGPHGFFHWGVRVAAVTVENIDVRQPQALQRLVQRGQQVFTRTEVTMRAGPHRVTRLGGDNQFIAIVREVFT